jgi:aldose 1-epimerase
MREMTFKQPATDVFGVTPDGRAIRKYVLKNQQGTQISAIDYGAIITSILLPKQDDGYDDVVLGYDDLAGYLNPQTPYFGAVIGRYANRIANGSFALAGKTYNLPRNDGRNHLHGGVRGFDKVIWAGEPFATDRVTGVRFCYTSPDGEEGYPGTLTAVVRYSLTYENELICDYRATTTKSTPVNLTQHSYFNLNGVRGSGHSRPQYRDQCRCVHTDRTYPDPDGGDRSRCRYAVRLAHRKTDRRIRKFV